MIKEERRCETTLGDDTILANSSTDDWPQNSKYYPSKPTFYENSNMGEKSTAFGTLITLVCKTAKKTVNKIARIRRRKLSSLEEPKKQLQNKEPPLTPTLQPRHSSQYTEPENGKTFILG